MLVAPTTIASRQTLKFSLSTSALPPDEDPLTHLHLQRQQCGPPPPRGHLRLPHRQRLSPHLRTAGAHPEGKRRVILREKDQVMGLRKPGLNEAAGKVTNGNEPRRRRRESPLPAAGHPAAPAQLKAGHEHGGRD